MRRMFTFVLGIGLGGLACLGAMNYQLVRAQDGFHVVGKQRARLGQVYVDTREFGPTDWLEHPELMVSLGAGNEQALLNEVSADLLQKGVKRLTGKSQEAR